MISNVSRDRVRHKWEGLQALENGPYFTAIKGDGPGRLTFSTSSGNVELVGAPPSPGETEVQKGELKPDIPREMKVQKGELKPDIPKERGRQQPTVEEEDDEDDWTMVESEDGGQVPTKRPPPSYDDTMRR